MASQVSFNEVLLPRTDLTRADYWATRSQHF